MRSPARWTSSSTGRWSSDGSATRSPRLSWRFRAVSGRPTPHRQTTHPVGQPLAPYGLVLGEARGAQQETASFRRRLPRSRCSSCQPRLITPAQVGCVGEANPLQGVGSKAGAVALVADKDDATVGVVGDRQTMGAGRVEPPLEDVSIDDEGAGKFPVALTLVMRADVDDEGAGGLGGSEVLGLDPVEITASLLKQAADGRLVGTRHELTIRRHLGMRVIGRIRRQLNALSCR